MAGERICEESVEIKLELIVDNNLGGINIFYLKVFCGECAGSNFNTAVAPLTVDILVVVLTQNSSWIRC